MKMIKFDCEYRLILTLASNFTNRADDAVEDNDDAREDVVKGNSNITWVTPLKAKEEFKVI